jgi:hypothetical protein
MRSLSYTLNYSPNNSSQGLGQGSKKAIRQLSRESPPLPGGLAGINLETKKKYSNIYPPTSLWPHKITGIFRSLGYRIKERFARDYKPVDHLGGVSPIETKYLNSFTKENEINHDLEGWPKSGSTFENMDIIVL